jgi:beta-lactamase superfamily II metal-dependent hydrolase
MLKVAMLPARQGDCLWISYGAEDAPHHLVIDGGPERSQILRSHIEKKLRTGRPLHIDLLVVTHIDNDHIGGVLDLLEEPPPGLTFTDIWFNAHRHLLPPDLLGREQGDRLSDLLKDKGLPWNEAFKGGAVAIPDKGDLPRRERQDGLVITLLGPDREGLRRLHGKWPEVVNAKGEGEAEAIRCETEPEDLLGRRDDWPPDIRALAQKQFESDQGEANGSSIAFLVEYEGKRVLCPGDAFAGRLIDSIDRLPFDEERLRLKAFKLSHHGSRKSTSSDLLKRVACSRYLISTNGSYFGHPDAEVLARVLTHGGSNPQLIFNSNSPFARCWADPTVKNAPPYRTLFPEGLEGSEIKL